MEGVGVGEKECIENERNNKKGVASRVWRGGVGRAKGNTKSESEIHSRFYQLEIYWDNDVTRERMLGSTH